MSEYPIYNRSCGESPFAPVLSSESITSRYRSHQHLSDHGRGEGTAAISGRYSMRRTSSPASIRRTHIQRAGVPEAVSCIRSQEPGHLSKWRACRRPRRAMRGYVSGTERGCLSPEGQARERARADEVEGWRSMNAAGVASDENRGALDNRKAPAKRYA